MTSGRDDKPPAAHLLVADLQSPVVESADAHHVASVLRVRPGEMVSATDGKGGFRRFRWAGPAGLEPAGEVEKAVRPEPPIGVGFAPVKGERTEWAVQKLTELGVDRIVLLRTDRSVVRWQGSRAAGHVERLGRVARSALSQSRGVWLPVIEIREFDLVVGEAVSMAVPGARGPLTLRAPTVIVGPEGGWSPHEEQAEVVKIGLGPNVLRSETAAVTAGALLSALRAGVVSQA